MLGRNSLRPKGGVGVSQRRNRSKSTPGRREKSCKVSVSRECRVFEAGMKAEVMLCKISAVFLRSLDKGVKIEI